MGWKDDPVVSDTANRPAWAQDAVVSQQAPSAPSRAAGIGMRPAAVVNTPESNNTWGQATRNVYDAGMNLGTSVVGGLAGDVAGLGTLGYDVVANAVMHPFSPADPGAYGDPAAVRQAVQTYLSYTPQDQQSLSNQIVTAPGKVIGGASEYLTEKATNLGGEGKHPYLGRVAGGIPLTVANLLGLKAGTPATFNAKAYGGGARVPVPEAVPGAPVYQPEATPHEVAIKNATDAGFKLSPAQAGDKVGRAVASPAGRAQLDRELSRHNATVADNLAKKTLGLDPKRQLNDATLNELKSKANEAYGDVAATGKRTTSDAYREDIYKITDQTGAKSFPKDTPKAVENLKRIYSNIKVFDAADAVAKIRQLRNDAKGNLKLDDPEKVALGRAQRQVADALDAELARHVEALGKPELAAKYKAARVQWAKIHSVEDAMDGGNVSARELSKQKARGVPLSPELRIIADAYDSFDTVLQQVNKIRDHGPLSAVDYLLGVGGATTNPALAAAVLARPAARAIIKSDAYQRRFIAPKGKAAVTPPAAPGVAPARTTNALASRKREAG